MAPIKKTCKNKAYCKRYRQKDPEKYRKSDAERKRMSRLLLKENPIAHEEQKMKNRIRMRMARDQKKKAAQDGGIANQSVSEAESTSETFTSPGPSSENTPSSFSTKQSRCRSLSRAEKGLPNSPNKRREIIGTLAKKYEMRIVMRKRGRKHRELSEDEEHWLVEFLERADMTYINPGKKDHVYVGKVEGVSQYVQKQYLLWTLRDLLDIINGNEIAGVSTNESFLSVFQHKISFGKLYQFIKNHKQYIFNKNIPHSTCLCEVCENACLLAKGINKSLCLTLPTNPHDIVEDYSCSSSDSECMSSTCSTCATSCCWTSDEYDQDEPPESDQSSAVECREVSFYKWTRKDDKVQKICITLEEDESKENWRETVHILKGHIYRKRKQVEHYNYLKENLGKGECIVNVDYSESYSNTQQDEIQSAYFGHTNFSLFTACGYYRSNLGELSKVPMTIVSESSDHSRIAAFSCVSKVIETLEKVMTDPMKIIYVWSDGCTSQFRSRFVFALLMHLHPDKYLEWHYNEAHHGKGPMDGIGGTIKNQVFQYVKSGKIVISNPSEFSIHANKIIPSVTTIYVPVEDIPDEPEEVANAPAIPGTLKIHKIARKMNAQQVFFLEFYYLSNDKESMYTQYYRRRNDPIVCGHAPFKGGSNFCGFCKSRYQKDSKEEWLECPICKQWYHESCFSN